MTSVECIEALKVATDMLPGKATGKERRIVFYLFSKQLNARHFAINKDGVLILDGSQSVKEIKAGTPNEKYLTTNLLPDYFIPFGVITGVGALWMPE